MFIYPSGKPGSLRISSINDLLAYSSFPAGLGSFVYPPAPDGEDATKVSLTTFVIADFDSDEGLQLLQESLKAIVSVGLFC